MRATYITLFATITALASATPVPSTPEGQIVPGSPDGQPAPGSLDGQPVPSGPKYDHIADYFREPDQAFAQVDETAQRIFDNCLMRYLQSPNFKPEDFFKVPGKHFHDFCLSEARRLTVPTVNPKTGLERARQLKKVAARYSDERDRAGDDEETTEPGAAYPVPKPESPQTPAEAQSAGGMNALKLPDGLTRMLSSFSKVNAGQQGKGATAPIGGFAPSLPQFAGW
ncbi:MAG: hypothetical protein M1816_004641 [Peltula sp. TS41687]|nr:MAG: hypothetical protein M1816_004641 [Peltula sp. TS41687]